MNFDLLSSRQGERSRRARKLLPGPSQSGWVEQLERRELLTLQVGPITTTAGQTFSGPVATFAAGDVQGGLSDFTATINWGGALSPTTAGTITSNGQGVYTVYSSNIYPNSGTFPVSVIVTGANNTTATSSGTATVSDAALTTTAVTVTPSRQTQFSGIVASFQSANPYATTTDFTATINWGDGVNTQVPGTISAGNNGTFNVIGQNNYANAGTFPITVEIESPAGTLTVVNSTANVTTQPLQMFPINVVGGVKQSLSPTVVNFLDPYSNDTSGDFEASINWGDGTPTTPGTIAEGTNGVYSVTGTHTYTVTGTYTVTTQVTRIANGQVTVATGQAVISASAPVITPIGALITTPAGVLLQNSTVGSFTDTTTTNFTAVINWADGHTSAGIVMSEGSGLFAVIGTHLYTAPGTSSPIITVEDQNGNSATINSTAIVTGPVLTPIPTTISPSVGQPYTGIVGSIYDANGTGDSISATINWGNGTISKGIVMPVPNSDEFNISGANTYTTAGTDPITISVVNTAGQSITINSSAMISAPTIIATGTTFSTVDAATGVAIASFTDSNLSANAGNIKAVIQWGDGKSTNGSVTEVAGVYNVTGSHPYTILTSTGSYAVTVMITDPSGQTATVNSTALVVAPVLSGIPLTVNFTAGTPPSSPLVIGSFFDTNVNAMPTDFTVSINWGAGQSSTGTVTASTTTPGLFLVSGTYLYPMSGTYGVTISVSDNKGDTTLINSSAIVADNIATTPANFGFTGGLALNGSNGPNASKYYTNTNQPTFSGTAVPFSIVQLYATYWGVDAVQPLGEAVANANGQWTLTVGPLATGTYTVTATQTPPGGYPLAVSLTNNGLVHIDMTPPKHPKVTHHPMRPKHPNPPPPFPKARSAHRHDRSKAANR